MKLISTAVAATMIAGGIAKLNRFPAYEQMVEGASSTSTLTSARWW